MGDTLVQKKGPNWGHVKKVQLCTLLGALSGIGGTPLSAQINFFGDFGSVARTANSADCKRGRRKGATSKTVKNRQKASKSFSTLFDNFRAGQKTSKIVKKCQKVFRHCSTIFARHLFSGPFCNPLTNSQFWGGFQTPEKSLAHNLCKACNSLGGIWREAVQQKRPWVRTIVKPLWWLSPSRLMASPCQHWP